MNKENQPIELFFMRLKNNKKSFVHYESGETYKIVEKLEGAAMWKWLEGKRFIEFSKASNLELVNCKELLNIEP